MKKLTPTPWRQEELLTNADLFFSSLEQGISEAKLSIAFETYIFEDGGIGKRIETALIAAAKREVIVQVVVDGVGSQGWIFSVGARLLANGVQIKVYHQLPWEHIFSSGPRWEGSPSWTTLFKYINRRNHRKVCVIDNRCAWVGSMNVWDVTSIAINGNNAWREMGIKVEGESVVYLLAAFKLAWFPHILRHHKLRREAQHLVKESRTSLVRLNTRFGLRLKLYQDLLERIKGASSRIWIATAYFVPAGSLISALSDAAKRGVDVRLLVASRSDIFFMPWVSAAFQESLLRTNIKMSAYQPSIYHAKYMIIDNWTMIGSSNINQRSLLHDLEADITSENIKTVNAVASEFQIDQSLSQAITAQHFNRRPLWQKLLGRISLLFGHFL